jgi:hypothetical protein
VARPLEASGVFRPTTANRGRRAIVCGSHSRLTQVALSPAAPDWVPTNARNAVFGLPRDGFGFFTGLFDRGEQDAGERIRRQGARTGCEHQLAELRLLLFLGGLGIILKCLDLGVWFAGLAVAGRRARGRG